MTIFQVEVWKLMTIDLTPDYLVLEPKHLDSWLEFRFGTELGIAIQAREVSELVSEL